MLAKSDYEQLILEECVKFRTEGLQVMSEDELPFCLQQHRASNGDVQVSGKAFQKHSVIRSARMLRYFGKLQDKLKLGPSVQKAGGEPMMRHECMRHLAHSKTNVSS